MLTHRTGLTPLLIPPSPPPIGLGIWSFAIVLVLLHILSASIVMSDTSTPMMNNAVENLPASTMRIRREQISAPLAFRFHTWKGFWGWKRDLQSRALAICSSLLPSRCKHSSANVPKIKTCSSARERGVSKALSCNIQVKIEIREESELRQSRQLNFRSSWSWLGDNLLISHWQHQSEMGGWSCILQGVGRHCSAGQRRILTVADSPYYTSSLCLRYKGYGMFIIRNYLSKNKVLREDWLYLWGMQGGNSLLHKSIKALIACMH